MLVCSITSQLKMIKKLCSLNKGAHQHLSDYFPVLYIGYSLVPLRQFRPILIQEVINFLSVFIGS